MYTSGVLLRACMACIVSVRPQSNACLILAMAAQSACLSWRTVLVRQLYPLKLIAGLLAHAGMQEQPSWQGALGRQRAAELANSAAARHRGLLIRWVRLAGRSHVLCCKLLGLLRRNEAHAAVCRT